MSVGVHDAFHEHLEIFIISFMVLKGCLIFEYALGNISIFFLFSFFFFFSFLVLNKIKNKKNKNKIKKSWILFEKNEKVFIGGFGRKHYCDTIFWHFFGCTLSH